MVNAALFSYTYYFLLNTNVSNVWLLFLTHYSFVIVLLDINVW